MSQTIRIKPLLILRLSILVWVMHSAMAYAQNPKSAQANTSDSLPQAEKNYDYEAYFKDYIAKEIDIEKSTDTTLKIQHYYNNSSKFYGLGLYNQSIKLSRKGIALDSDFNNLKSPHFTLLSYTNIAKSQNALGLHDEAKSTYKTILKIAEKVNIRRVAAACNNLALHYFEYDKALDSALIYFKRAQEIMTTNDVEGMDLLGFINGNIADILVKKQDYTSALPYYKNNYYNFFSPNAKESRLKRAYFQNGIELANMYLKLNDTQKASQLLDSISTTLDTIKPFKTIERINLKLLQSKRALAQKNNQPKNVYDLSIAIEKLKDSINLVRERAQQLGTNMLGDQVTKRYETLLENERLKTENIKQKNQTRFWIVTSMFILILGMLLFVFYRYRQRLSMVQKNKELAEEKALTKSLENQLLAQSLEYQKKDLTSLALSTNRNLKWLQNLENRLNNFQKNTNFKKEAFLDELKKLVDEKKRINTFTDTLHQKIAAVNSEFYDHLKQQHPKLTAYEIKLCALIRINLDTKDIATILNISPTSANTSKYRLRKKLNLKPEDDLFDYLNAL